MQITHEEQCCIIKKKCSQGILTQEISSSIIFSKAVKVNAYGMKIC